MARLPSWPRPGNKTYTIRKKRGSRSCSLIFTQDTCDTKSLHGALSKPWLKLILQWVPQNVHYCCCCFKCVVIISSPPHEHACSWLHEKHTCWQPSPCGWLLLGTSCFACPTPVRCGRHCQKPLCRRWQTPLMSPAWESESKEHDMTQNDKMPHFSSPGANTP